MFNYAVVLSQLSRRGPLIAIVCGGHANILDDKLSNVEIDPIAKSVQHPQYSVIVQGIGFGF